MTVAFAIDENGMVDVIALLQYVPLHEMCGVHEQSRSGTVTGVFYDSS